MNWWSGVGSGDEAVLREYRYRGSGGKTDHITMFITLPCLGARVCCMYTHTWAADHAEVRETRLLEALWSEIVLADDSHARYELLLGALDGLNFETKMLFKLKVLRLRIACFSRVQDWKEVLERAAGKFVDLGKMST